MRYIINHAELFDESEHKTVIKNMKEPTNDIEKFRNELYAKYGCKRILFRYMQVE